MVLPLRDKNKPLFESRTEKGQLPILDLTEKRVQVYRG
jgi:hypothetical protein